MLTEEYEDLMNPESDAHKLFRLRFRVPFTIFLMLLNWTKEWYCYSESNPNGVRDRDALGRPSVPLSLKVRMNLCALYFDYVMYIRF